LAVLHTVFMREHNRIARQLVTTNSHWTDERIYQESRRILNAEYQHIIYNEFLPVLLGHQYMSSFGLLPLTSGFSRDYSDSFDPSVTNEFSTAAYRVGHTLIPRIIEMYDAVRKNLQVSMDSLDIGWSDS
jgi:peroxidase